MSKDPMGISLLAKQVWHQRDVRDRPHPAPEALVVHTTGRGIYAQASKRKIDGLAVVLEEYQTPGNNFAHYVIDLNGELYQIANETAQAWHCLVTSEERQAYLDGAWRSRVSQDGREAWDRAHGAEKNPASLLRTGSPNQATVGVELIPRRHAEPDGLFEAGQYAKLGALWADIAARWALVEFPAYGHEDLSPLSRWDIHGGWDPGALRASPYFDWARVPRPRLIRPGSDPLA